jgi:hypothetical protein
MVVEGGCRVPSVQTLITNNTIDQLSSIPGVVSVVPRDYIQVVQYKLNRLETYAGIIRVGTEDQAILA